MDRFDDDLGGARLTAAGVSRRGLLQAGLAATALAWAPAARAASGPIRIGWFAALSGPYATGALSQDAGTRAAVDELNAAGGLLGRKIDLVTRDTTGDPGKAVNFVQELLFREKVDVLMGPNSSGEAMPVRSFVTEANVVQFPTALIDQVIDPKAHPTMFRLAGSTGQQIDAGIDFALRNLGKKKIAIIVDSLSYGVLCRDLAIASLKRRGLEPAHVATIDQAKVDMGSDIVQARDSGADVALVWTASSGFMGRVLTARGEQGWTTPVIGAPIALTAQVSELVAAPHLADVLAVGFRHLVLDDAGSFSPAVRKVLESRPALIGPQIKNGVTWILLGWSTVMLWAKAVEKAKTTETDAVIAALEGLGDVETAFGQMRFGPGRRDGLSTDEYALLRVGTEKGGGYRAV